MKLDKNNHAWVLLLDDERLALQLNLGMSKSTWKSGEIMDKSHYKLIEIKDRAKTFLRIFTHHFAAHNNQIIPEDVKISPDLRLYLHLTIVGRLTIAKAIKKIDNPLFHHVATRDKVITEEVMKWKSSNNLSELDLFNLVMDFDRWNNFRILPKAIQEPSAFKRRDKNRLKKHLRIGTSLSPLAYKVIKKRFEYKGSQKIKAGWIILISPTIHKVLMLRIHNKAENRTDLSKASIYIFEQESIAELYLSLILEYVNKTDRHCREGLKFWPQYRDMIKKAINYEQIQNIIPSRRNLEFIEPKRSRKKFI